MVVSPQRRLLAHLRHRPDPLTSLVLTMPVFVIYHLGILLVDLRNGVDLVSELTLELLHHSRLAYAAATVALACGLAAAAWWSRRRARVRPEAWPPLLAESAFWAAAMWLTVGWTTAQVVPWQIGPRALGPLEKLVMASGAGFHEEVVFRVVVFGGGAYALRAVMRPTAAVAVAAAGSALLFAAIHYLGPLGDAFGLQSFVFRALAGLFLTAVYRWRGFAVAVYTHVVYDLFVMFFSG